MAKYYKLFAALVFVFLLCWSTDSSIEDWASGIQGKSDYLIISLPYSTHVWNFGQSLTILKAYTE